jgi:hypothetical protein
MKKKRPHTDTTVPNVPADVRTIMDALLRTMPPPAGDKSTRKAKRGTLKRKRR